MHNSYQKLPNTDAFTNLHEVQQSNSWVEIDPRALSHNIALYKKVINNTQLAVVIKSNAYGHGINEIAQLCERDTNVNYLCTVSSSEALFLRAKNIQKPILVLSMVQNNLEEIILNTLDLVIFDIELAHELNILGKKLNKIVYVHIKVDTGLSRLGLLIEQAYTFIHQVCLLSHVIIRGIFTHFADSENIDQTFVNHQVEQFSILIAKLERENIHIPIKHTSCSAAVTANNYHYNLVRVGIGAYGLWPSGDNKLVTQREYPGFLLKPVLTWKTRILQLKKIPAQSYIGYDRTHKTEQPTTLAVIAAGYWDGFDRQLSNSAHVVINNKLCPVVGRIAMNMAMVDVTHITVHIDDDVILLGNYSGVTADDLAKHCQTINYEIVTRINPLLPRLIV